MAAVLPLVRTKLQLALLFLQSAWGGALVDGAVLPLGIQARVGVRPPPLVLDLGLSFACGVKLTTVKI